MKTCITAAICSVVVGLSGCVGMHGRLAGNWRVVGGPPPVTSVGREKSSDYDVKLRLQRRSIHLGETVLCRANLTTKGAAQIQAIAGSVRWEVGRPIWEIPFAPVALGTQDIGPVELKLPGLRLLSDSVPITVLPALGTNRVMEVRVLDRRVVRGQSVEVVFQWQACERIRFPSLTEMEPSLDVAVPDWRKGSTGWWGDGFAGPIVQTADWHVYSDMIGNRYSCSSSVGKDADGLYLVEGGIKTYVVRPRRIGELKLTKELFREVFRKERPAPEIPASLTFEPIVITVVDEPRQTGVTGFPR